MFGFQKNWEKIETKIKNKNRLKVNKLFLCNCLNSFNLFLFII